MDRVSVAEAVAIGGKVWQVRKVRRPRAGGGTGVEVHLSDWPQYLGLTVTRDVYGRVEKAWLWNEKIAPEAAQRILDTVRAVWVDGTQGRVHVRVAPGVLRDGDPLPARRIQYHIMAGVRQAVAENRRHRSRAR